MIDLPGFEPWTGYGQNELLKYVRSKLQIAAATGRQIKGQQYTIKSGKRLPLILTSASNSS